MYPTQAKGRLVSINTSPEKGTEKRPVEGAFVTRMGLRGDAHAGDWHRQVSLLSAEAIRRFEAEVGERFTPGAFAENLTVEGIPLDEVSVLDHFSCGAVRFEVTQIGKACHGDTCSVYRQVGRCLMPQSGLFCRVLAEGELDPRLAFRWQPRPLKVKVITLSDRIFRGIGEDTSGPAILDHLQAFFGPKRWHDAYAYHLLSDAKEPLIQHLEAAVRDKVDIVITTGGTGIGPRDNAPECVLQVAEKTIPGIMEAVRGKHGAAHPNALLSRSVAAYRDTTLFYTLPGSLRAVNEYLEEILKSLEHALLMLHGVGH